VLKIPEEKKLNESPKKSNQDVYDAVNQKKAEPVASPVAPNPLDELEQFEMPAREAPSPAGQPSAPSPQSEVPEAPSYDTPNYSAPSMGPSFQQPQISTDYIQQLAEEVVEEKWDDLMSKVGDIRLWKDKIDGDIVSIKQEIMRTQNHFANLQKAVLGKVSEYNENILNINTEMKSLEKVFEKILQPLTMNIKELNKITSKLKTKKI
tara:strand:- start:2670 stop:3290 length:621 start_codon:yes stop_codon:yes gene_type:complete